VSLIAAVTSVMASVLVGNFAPAAEAGTRPAGGFYSVLAAGQGHTANARALANFEAHGTVPASYTNQAKLYDRLIALAPHVTWANLGQVFKSSAFGVAAGAPRTTETPKSGVTILWDQRYDIPHVYGRTRADVMFGAGYACAEARLFLMDVLRHTARGTLSELAGAGPHNDTVAMDAAQLKFADYSEAELRRQIAYDGQQLGPAGRQVVTDGRNYVAGINQYIREARVDPNKLPGEYVALDQLPQPWSLTDSVAIASLINEQQGSGGGAQARESQLLEAINRRFGQRDGARVYADLREQDDRDAPVTVTEHFPWPLTGRLDPRSVAPLDYGSVRSRNPIVADSSGPAPDLSGTAKPSPAWLRWIQTHRVTFPHDESNATLISARHSSSGHPLFVAGPQVGYYSPEILFEEDLHGGGINAEGASFPGISEYVLLGHGRRFAWSATSAGSEQEQIFAERLCNPDGSQPSRASNHYMYKGRCLPFLERNQVLHTGPSPANPTDSRQTITLRIERSVHGPIQGTATVRGHPVALALARSSCFHEADAAVFFERLNDGQVSSARGFRQAVSGVNSSFNWFYADDRDIAYQLSGDYPIWARGADPNLPIWGTGAYDWRHFDPAHYTSARIPASGLPGAINPARGYLISWNNKPAPGWRAASDTLVWGTVFRSQLLESRVRSALAHGAQLDLPQTVAIMGEAATADLRGQEDYPWMRRVIGHPSDPKLAHLLALLDAWSRSGSYRRDRTRSGYYQDSAAVALLDAWWNRLAPLYFSHSLGPKVGAALNALVSYNDEPNGQGDAFYGGFYSYIQKDLRDLLARPGHSHGTRAGRPRAPYSRIYCARGSLRSCRALLISTLRHAAGLLAKRYGSANPAAWKVRSTCPSGQAPPRCFEIQFITAGAIDTPPIPWQNRGTFQQAVSVP
jgi:acyl-homoserine lactone acylase PvdQ